MLYKTLPIKHVCRAVCVIQAREASSALCVGLGELARWIVTEWLWFFFYDAGTYNILHAVSTCHLALGAALIAQLPRQARMGSHLGIGGAPISAALHFVCHVCSLLCTTYNSADRFYCLLMMTFTCSIHDCTSNNEEHVQWINAQRLRMSVHCSLDDPGTLTKYTHSEQSNDSLQLVYCALTEGFIAFSSWLLRSLHNASDCE